MAETKSTRATRRKPTPAQVAAARQRLRQPDARAAFTRGRLLQNDQAEDARRPEAAAAQTPELQAIRRRLLTAHSVLETAARALENSDAYDTEITQEVSALRHGLELLDGACDALSDYPVVLEGQS